MSTNEIKALESRVEELEEQLKQARRLLQEARNAHAGIAVGDVVRDRRGNEYKVAKIEHWGFRGKPSLHGSKKLKDGKWHKGAPHYIGSEWEKV